MRRLLKAIEKRKSDEEYMIRIHAGIQAIATVKALGAAFDGKEITLEELVGKPMEDMKVEPINTNTEDVEKWKEEAKKRGLKIDNN